MHVHFFFVRIEMKVIRRKRFFWLKEKKSDLLVVCKIYAYVLMFNLLVLKVTVLGKSPWRFGSILDSVHTQHSRRMF